jgi:Holliday junction resolvase RusA-like endonuclease
MRYSAEFLWKMYIPITPMAKQSVRFNPQTGFAYQPAKVKKYVNLLKQILKSNRPPELFEGDLEIRICFSFKWLKSHTKKTRKLGWVFKRKKPDSDNLQKPLFDALNGIIIKDDSNFVHPDPVKIHSAEDYISIIINRVTPIRDILINP